MDCCRLCTINAQQIEQARVREYVFYVFSYFKKHDFLRFFWNDVSKSRKILSKRLVLNPSKWVHMLRSMITVIQFPDPRVWSIVSHCWTSSVNDVRFWQQWRGTINIKQPWKIIRTFFTFFWKSKKHDFLRFLSCCTRFLEHWNKRSLSLRRWQMKDDKKVSVLDEYSNSKLFGWHSEHLWAMHSRSPLCCPVSVDDRWKALLRRYRLNRRVSA